MEVNGNRCGACLRSQSSVVYGTEGVEVIGRGCLCCVWHRCKKEFLVLVRSYTRCPEGYSVEEGLWGCLGTLTLYMLTKFEVFSFKRFGDIKGVTKYKSRSRDPQHHLI